MATKYELANYLSNLLSILSSKDEAAISRGTTLPWEYERAYVELRDILQKEKDEADEARKS